MAKVVFSKFRSQFDSCCFLENLREESEKHDLKYIRDKIFNELSNDTSHEGLSRRKVLIVLDDVSDTSQLDYLENEASPFRQGSKVIITSRDRHVLEGRVERIHEAIALGHDNSLKLFNHKSFRKYGYKSEYKELVERALAYAQGVPLALTMLGSFLHSKTIEQWESALSKLERRTHPNIQVVLKLSYDGLDDEEKEMHDLIQSMAFEIVRQECLKNPERRSRLWNPDEIYDVLKHNRGSDAIQGISLDLSQIRDLQLSTDTFKKMTNLRFLKFYSSWTQRPCTMNLPYGLDSFSKSLCYLQWDNFPSKSLPLPFCAEKLVELHMPNSHLKKLWDGVQNLVNLRIIVLIGSKHLMELPDISRAQNLKGLYLQGCESLSHLDPSILSLPRLDRLILTGCRSLKSFKTERHRKSLPITNVYGCTRLKEFSLSEACKLTELPHNIKHLSRLRYLTVSNCKSLQSLPELPPSIEELHAFDCTSLKTLQLTSHIESSMLAKEKVLRSTLYSSVSHLKKLTLYGCEQLYELPESIGSLFSLYLLDLRESNIESLPASIKHLLNLEKIYLSNCRRLCSLPELPFFIETVDADGCISLEIMPTLATAPYLTSLLLKDCLKLENRYMESVCFPLKLAIYTTEACGFCYTGRKVPEWFKSNQGIYAYNNISIELPSTTTDLIGFALCSVLSHHAHGYLQCQLYYDGKKHTCSEFKGVMTNFDSHHVFLWCVSDMFINFGKTMDDQNTNYRPNMSFEFSIVINSEKSIDGVIEACGVCPIYASEYRKFIEQMELDAQKETCQDAYENSLHGILKYVNFSFKTGKCGNLEGSNIPEWFTCKSSMIDHFGSLKASVQLAPDFDKLMGFIFFFVIPNFSSKERDQCYSYSSCCSDYWCDVYNDTDFIGPSGWHYSMIKLNSDNVFLWYDPFCNECILKRLRRGTGCDAKLDLIFSFNLGYGLNDRGHFRVGHCLIKEYGVRPIYLSEYTNFLQQEKLNISMQTKRSQNINDDQQQLPSTKKLKESSID
ncbi:hypothetical protein K1719_030769 [Acacia pycnantha]|nr:hypothetical protein K1719_030769 [Acacia pycnantha]